MSREILQGLRVDHSFMQPRLINGDDVEVAICVSDEVADLIVSAVKKNDVEETNEQR